MVMFFHQRTPSTSIIGTTIISLSVSPMISCGTTCTGCIEGFFETKKGIKNATESENSISNFVIQKVIKFELLLG